MVEGYCRIISSLNSLKSNKNKLKPMQIAKKSLENCMSQDAIRKWTRGWTGHVLHNFHWFGIPIFFVCWFFCDPNDNAATLSALLQDCMLTFASVSNLVLMEIQISFHMACSMPLYPLGRKKKGKKQKWLARFAACSGILILPPCTLVSPPQRTEQGEIQAQEPRAALSEPPSPEHEGMETQKKTGISLSLLKINECDRKGTLVSANRRAEPLLRMG